MKRMLRMIRFIFFLLFLCMTVGVKADDLSVIKKKYIESILCTNSDSLLTTLMCQTPREKIVGDQMIVELMERYPIEVEYVQNLIHTSPINKFLYQSVQLGIVMYYLLL